VSVALVVLVALLFKRMRNPDKKWNSAQSYTTDAESGISGSSSMQSARSSVVDLEDYIPEDKEEFTGKNTDFHPVPAIEVPAIGDQFNIDNTELNEKTMEAIAGLYDSGEDLSMSLPPTPQQHAQVHGQDVAEPSQPQAPNFQRLQRAPFNGMRFNESSGSSFT